MDAPADITLALTIVAAGLVAGGQLFCLFAVIPAFNDWTPQMGVFVHQHALSRRPHHYLRVVSPIAMAGAVATVAIDRELDAAGILLVVGFLLGFLNLAYSRREWPINHEIDSYGAEPTEDQVRRYLELRKLWDRQHVVRTISTNLGFACFAAAAVIA